jgi:hypothetical protein
MLSDNGGRIVSVIAVPGGIRREIPLQRAIG